MHMFRFFSGITFHLLTRLTIGNIFLGKNKRYLLPKTYKCHEHTSDASLIAPQKSRRREDLVGLSASSPDNCFKGIKKGERKMWFTLDLQFLSFHNPYSFISFCHTFLHPFSKSFKFLNYYCRVSVNASPAQVLVF